MTDPDPELDVLQKQWSPGWKIWRARGSKDPATKITRKGSLCASLIDERVGVRRFLMSSSPEALEAALEANAAAANGAAHGDLEPPLFP